MVGAANNCTDTQTMLDLTQKYIEIPTHLANKLDILKSQLESIPFERKEEAIKITNQIIETMEEIRKHNLPIQ